MSKTYTPELTPEVLERLQHYAQLFREDFRHQAQATYSGIYLQGLLHDGERKSIEPLSRRVTLPPNLTIKLIFYSCASVFDVSGQVPLHPEQPSATTSRTLSA